MKRTFMKIMTVLILVFLPISVSLAAENKFRIYDFVVEVGNYNPVRTNQPSVFGRPTTDIRINRPTDLDGKVISGSGVTTIKGKRVNILFNNIKLKHDIRTSLPGRHASTNVVPLVAISGVVKGTSGNAPISYLMGSNKVLVNPKTLIIEPRQAKAVVSVHANFDHFTDRISPLVLTAPIANVSSNGSVAGTNFKSTVSMELKSTPFSLNILATDDYRINLGNKFSVTTYGQRGVNIKGSVLKDNVETFLFTGVIREDRTVALNMALNQPFDSRPDGYFLHVKSGAVYVSYSADGVSAISGNFITDITIPDDIRDHANQPLSKLIDVELRLDNEAGLYSQVVIVEKIRIGQSFTVEPDQSGAWAYFPDWIINGSSTHYQKKPRICSEWRAIFEELLDKTWDGQERKPIYDIRRRPGITLTRGVVYFNSPQITHPTNNAPITVKSRITGAMTLTTLGVVGPMSGDSFYFVPVDADIRLGDGSMTPSKTSWKTILDAGATLPERLSHRFNLADLRILDMQLKGAYFCLSELEQGSAEFNYTVHFPHPSYINLLFEDKSLKRNGLFSMAKGPVVATTLYVPSNVSPVQLNNIGHELPKGTVVLPNPDTHILWAWRLPVSFSDRGVHIDYVTTGDMGSNIQVKMFDLSSQEPEGVLSEYQISATAQNAEAVGVINSSEIWLKPLYSKGKIEFP